MDVKLLENTLSQNVLKPRCYYIPKGSKTDLNGQWKIKAFPSVHRIDGNFLDPILNKESFSF